MKYYIIAGEASGDLHASNMVKELKKLDIEGIYRFWGGDLMRDVIGKEPVKHIKELAFMGFVEVLLNLRTIAKNFKVCKKDVLDFHPDVLILVDYPGFNLRMAEWAKQNNIRVYYYISPTIWAWKENRVEKIKKYVDKLFVILPFELDVYKKHNYPVDFVGHPLLDAIEQHKLNAVSEEEFVQSNNLNSKPIIAILPGSRRQEINRMLSIMIDVVPNFSDYQFVIAGTTNLSSNDYDLATKNGIKVVYNKTYDLLNNAVAGIIKSGTSTLESALFDVPQVVCYKGGRLSIWIAKKLVKIKYISLVNLILDTNVVKELIQEEMTAKNITKELNSILTDTNHRGKIKLNYFNLNKMLGGVGASKRIASLIVNYLTNSKKAEPSI